MSQVQQVMARNLLVAIAKENIFAAQFHPEKSAELGLQLLDNFISWKI